MIARRHLNRAILVMGAGGARASAQPAESILDRIKRTGVMRVGVVNAQPPYCTKDLASGEWSGFVIDIARNLAAEQGVTAQPVESTWGNAVLEVQADKVDIFFGLAPTPQRALAVDFTLPLYQNAFAVIARRGFAAARWDDLNNPKVRVAVEVGSVYDQSVAQLIPSATIVRLRTANDALMNVQSGQADCQIIVVILGLTILAKTPALGSLIVPKPVFGSATAAIVAKRTNAVWRQTVDEWVTRQRNAGFFRRVLVANLERVGVSQVDIPPELLF